MSLAEGVKQIFERTEAEKKELSATELILDGSNKVSFPGFPYLFEALGRKVIVSIDIFKSGYECRVCKGKKRIETKCTCVTRGRPGYKYSELDLASFGTIDSAIIVARKMMRCPECSGDWKANERSEVCSECKGLGALLVLPDTSKNLPTTGVVVSIGNKVKREKLNYDIGDRILFGPYAGNLIPTRSGLLFKIIDANQAWCRVDGAQELGSFDFILNDEVSS